MSGNQIDFETKNFKDIPDFSSEEEEHEFWATHDSTEYIDWDNAEKALFPKLKPSTKTIVRRRRMTVQEIQNEITQLPLPNLQELFSWFEEYQASLWDRRIESDLAAGRLDVLLAEVDAEYEAGLAQPL